MALTKKKAASAAGPAPETAAEKPVAEPAAEKAAAKKVPSAKSVLKKAAGKKTAEKAERVEEIFLQSGGAEWNITECRKRVIAAYVAEGHRESGIKKLEIYLKPEEGKAYYVVNDSVNGSVDL